MALTKISTDGISDDAVTTDKLANAINTARDANTAKTTNATHSGEVTGATALTIADNVVDEANLKVSNSPTNGYFLSAQSGNTGGLTWAAVNTDLSNDSSPQLGGDLDSNGNNIKITDGEELRVGDGNDMVLKHTGSTNQFQSESHRLVISGSASDNVDIMHTQSEYMASFIPNGAVELYYDNSKKFETTSSGITISSDNSTGSILKGVTRFTPNNSTTVKAMWDEGGFSGAGHFQVKDGVAFTAGDSSDLKIYHDGTDSFIYGTTGTRQLKIRGQEVRVVNEANSEIMAKFIQDGAVELYHNNSKKAETASGGFTVTGNISVSGTVDGRDVASDGSKLDGIASGANNITNNNQLSNGAGYMSGSSSQLCKAFVNYSGNNNSIRNDYNVSSITDHGSGDQTVNFSSSISMSYTVCGMPIAHDTGGTRCTNAIRGSSSSGPTRMNSTGVRINRGFGSHNAFADGHTMCVAIFRP